MGRHRTESSRDKKLSRQREAKTPRGGQADHTHALTETERQIE